MAEIRHLNADGATTQALQSFGPFVSGALEVRSDKVKFGVENISDRVLGGTPFSQLLLEIEQTGTNDGFNFYYTADDGSGTISKPWGTDPAGAPTVVLAGGGSFVTGSYGVKIVAKNATGKTIGSTEATFDATTGQQATYGWVQTPGATGYEVHRTSTPGTYGASTLRAVIGSGATITYVDDGSATSSGTPPLVNTTGGAGPVYGTPPADGAFDQTDKVIATGPSGLAIGQQWFYWAQIRVPANTSEVGNTRTLNVAPVES
jgi:hypothetical protein